jgi:hypothetical protein
MGIDFSCTSERRSLWLFACQPINGGNAIQSLLSCQWQLYQIPSKSSPFASLRKLSIPTNLKANRQRYHQIQEERLLSKPDGLATIAVRVQLLEEHRQERVSLRLVKRVAMAMVRVVPELLKVIERDDGRA